MAVAAVSVEDSPRGAESEPRRDRNERGCEEKESRSPCRSRADALEEEKQDRHRKEEREPLDFSARRSREQATGEQLDRAIPGGRSEEERDRSNLEKEEERLALPATEE